MQRKTQHKYKQEASLKTTFQLAFQLDEDNALVATDEEDETSQCATSSLDGSENDGIDP